jgi:hypothetical protein
MDDELETGFNTFVMEIAKPFAGTLVARDAQGNVLEEAEVRAVVG